MPKTHKEHLKEHGYEPAVQNPYSNEATENAWEVLVKNNGEDNVWDYRILDEAFDTTHVDFVFGIMVGVVKRDTGESGNLSQTDFAFNVPRFYFDWRPTTEVSDDPV